MKPAFRLTFALAAILFAATLADAAGFTPAGLVPLANALGWLMMVLMGVKWILADSPNERADAKKGMIYIIIGLLLVASATSLVNMYCSMANSATGEAVC
jgi:hypothetical protein